MKKIMNVIFLISFLLLGYACRSSDFKLAPPIAEKDKVAIKDFNHAPFEKTSCLECHATQRPVRTPVHGDKLNCIECHSAALDKHGKRTWLNLTKFSHSAGILTCNQCHMTSDRDSRPVPKDNHPTIKYAKLDCVVCHKYVEKTKSWKEVTFDHLKHSPEPQSCNQCHDMVRPTSHTVNPKTEGMKSTDCVSCHGSKTDWKLSIKKFNHVNSNPQTCNQCHKNDAPKPIEKHPSAKEGYSKLDCVLCHTFIIANGTEKMSWKNLIFDQKTHKENTGNCTTCHRDLNNSLPISGTHDQGSRKNLTCNECHTFVTGSSWNKFGTFNHNKSESSESCESCHSPTTKILKNKTSVHVKTNLQCIECHNSRAWKPATYKHLKEDTNCLSCHNGKTASIKPVGHTLKGPDQCSICHDQNKWTPAWYDTKYVHSDKGNLPSRESNRRRGKIQFHPRANECSLCHDKKTESVVYTNKPFADTCLGCHDTAFRAQYHRGSMAARMKNCLECHNYSDWLL